MAWARLRVCQSGPERAWSGQDRPTIACPWQYMVRHGTCQGQVWPYKVVLGLRLLNLD